MKAEGVFCSATVPSAGVNMISNRVSEFPVSLDSSLLTPNLADPQKWTPLAQAHGCSMGHTWKQKQKSLFYVGLFS